MATKKEFPADFPAIDNIVVMTSTKMGILEAKVAARIFFADYPILVFVDGSYASWRTDFWTWGLDIKRVMPSDKDNQWTLTVKS